MRYFAIEQDSLNPGTFIVTLKLVVYRQLHGRYPEFLKRFDTADAARDGYSTKFWFLCKKEDGTDAAGMTLKEAKDLASKYEGKYWKILEFCEISGNWTTYPFEGLELIYHK